jgi:predicted ArsR family transcriptional regulator
MLYRLTDRAHELFPTVSNALTIQLLQITQKIYGATAPEKLLLHVFHQRTDDYRAQLKDKSLEERAGHLARLRDAEGYMSALEKSESGTLTIIEHHSPLLDVLAAFPIVAKIETDMFQQLLGVPVSRTEERTAGLFRATFQLG